ncbi:hypothetical protein SLS60_003420 [Paraconiothyrium brasiliense]|uniref:pyridoxal 5'-phosphate synthase n=1 Tax=Paraconiothyrium brasiliense TaxID=300254 RepID=A0ABR3RW11_9PLEO
MAHSATSMKSILRTLSSLKGPFPITNLADLPATPHSAFRLWLEDAIEQGEKEPHAMTLSTIDAYGHPDARVLILKNVDSRGWHFATKATSPKGSQIAVNSFVSLTFYWPQLGRQIRIRGRALELPASESADDFLERPDGSRISAVASKQSDVLLDGNTLENEIAKAKRLIEDTPGYVTPEWRVYAVDPVSVEFWQGAEDRKHQRIRYAKEIGDDEWTRAALYP